MPLAVNLAGERIGRLIVLRRIDSQRERNGDSVTMWLVRCDCGTEKSVRTQSLRSGCTLSCGCLKNERFGKISASLMGTAAMVAKRHEIAQKVKSEGRKRCSNPGCKSTESQPLSRFYKNKRSLDGYSSACRSCLMDKGIEYRYGITSSMKNDMIKAQAGKCANRRCGEKLGGNKTDHVDHDHSSGQVRGILCRSCNFALGFMKDSPAKITGLLDYAAEHCQLKLVAGGK